MSALLLIGSFAFPVASVVASAPIALTIVFSPKLFKKRLNRAVLAMTIVYMLLAAVRLAQYSCTSIYDSGSQNGSDQLLAFMLSCLLMIVCTLNVFMAFERYNLTVKGISSTSQWVTRLLFGALLSEIIALGFIFWFSTSSDGVTPSSKDLFIPWLVIFIATYVAALVCTLFYYLKTYKFALKILAENEAAIKHNRASSLKVLESLNNINSLATTQLMTQSAVSNMEVSSNMSCVDHMPQMISFLAGKDDARSVTLLPGNTAALMNQKGGTYRPTDVLPDFSKLVPELQTAHRSNQVNINHSAHTAVTSVQGSFNCMEIPPLPIKRAASAGADALNAARQVASVPVSTHSSITIPAADLPSEAAQAQPFPEMSQQHLDDLVERVRELSRSLDASLQQLQREKDRISLERRLLRGCLLMASSLVVCYMPFVAFLAFLATDADGVAGRSATSVDGGVWSDEWRAVVALAAVDPCVTPVLILYFQKDLRARVFGNLRAIVGLKNPVSQSDQAESFHHRDKC
ncbi:hypothetical protein HDU84_000771 [Entophlyctis sp. JEL0112]|nr:hypothetical protein HDU84_000771 [Entophlyctis sp. JEL0112]